jgi:hypothetical protein
MPTVDLADTPAWFQRFEQQYKRAAYLGLVSAAMKGVQEIQTKIIPSRTPQPVDRGVYRAGWRVVLEPPDAVVIENSETHAIFIEHGVRAERVKPGRKMITALTEWILRKGLDLRGDTPQQVAWRIARAMQRRGIFNPPPRVGGLGILAELVQSRLPTLIPEHVGREVQRAIKKGG